MLLTSFILSIIINIVLVVINIRLKMKGDRYRNIIAERAYDELPTNGRQPSADMETEYDYNLNK